MRGSNELGHVPRPSVWLLEEVEVAVEADEVLDDEVVLVVVVLAFVD